MLDALSFSLEITSPICFMLVLGILFKRFNIIDDHFIQVASKLVFKVTLPIMLFISILQAPAFTRDLMPLMWIGLAGNILFFTICHFIIKPLKYPHAQHSVIVQGAYRANTGIIGLAYVANTYQSHGIAIAALLVGVITILYNILAVIILTPPNTQQNKLETIKNMSISMLKNPLIISIALAFLYKSIHFPLPDLLLKTGGYFANITLPLALLCTGGSLDIKQFKQDSKAPWIATFLRLIAAPVFIVSLGYVFGLRHMELGILFFMSAGPSAATCYVMARAMKADATLAANIIALTTMMSLVSCTLGIAFLSKLNLM